MRQYSALLLRKKLVKTWKKKLPPELRSRLVGVNQIMIDLACSINDMLLIIRIKATLLQCLTQEKQ